MLAGIGAGLFEKLEDVARMSPTSRVFSPAMPAADRSAHLSRWADAVRRARSGSGGGG
jgi:glycerol kinase